MELAQLIKEMRTLAQKLRWLASGVAKEDGEPIRGYAAEIEAEARDLERTLVHQTPRLPKGH